MTKQTVRFVPLAMILSLLLLACGEDADQGDGAGTPPATPTETATTELTTPSPTPTTEATATEPTTTPTPTGEDTEAGMDGQTVAVAGVDYAYEGVPATVETGTELEFRNESDAELHELVLLRLPAGEERSVEELLALTEQEQDELLGDALVGVSVAMPGEDGMVVEGDLVADEPGRYIMVCFVPTSADPEAFMSAAEEAEGGPPQVEGGPPHVVNGMWAEFTVEG